MGQSFVGQSFVGQSLSLEAFLTMMQVALRLVAELKRWPENETQVFWKISGPT
ncbi:MAG: hypothetical protein ACFBSC_12575 [Microcoleaceae cyanobacterium]